MKKKISQKFFMITLLFFSFYYQSFCQSAPCSFDEGLEYELNETPDFQFLLEQGQEQMMEMTNNSPQAIMNGTVYTIPVVFHIIHLEDEAIGQGSNISEAQVLQALADLNSDFRDFPMEGNDVEIEFCLAQQDPLGNAEFNTDGDNITGIQRVDGTGTGDYENVGMTRFLDGNEVEVKALSNWPNTDYLNIWVVHNIAGKAVGFATFPFADDSKDGIVLETIATGTSDLSKVISHEAGHFFNLYHTFEGSSSYDSCPTNDNCLLDGDMMCQTRPHPYLGEDDNWFPCDEDEYEECDASEYIYDVTENHMNYTDNDCRNEFTSDQVMWMRCSLMTLRASLMNSLGCEPGCSDLIADFNVSAIDIMEKDEVDFTNVTINSTSSIPDYIWKINDESIELEDLTYKFDNRGIYKVCLTAIIPECTNRKCIEIRVVGPEPCYGSTSECDLLLNGDFHKTNFIFEEKSYNSIFESTTDRVCDWSSKNITADLVYRNDILATKMFSQHQDEYYEGIVTETPLFFETGKNYILEFDYLYAAKVPSDWDLSLKIGLAPTGDKYVDYTIDNLLFDFIDGPIIQKANPGSFWNSYTNSDFEHASLCISFEEDTNGHLFFLNEGDGIDLEILWIYLKDIEITCKEGCIPNPDFTFDEDCPNTFVGTNTGDGSIYEWEFKCDGYTASGSTVTRDFPAGTECEVCLTVSCDVENSKEICKTVIIPEEIPEDCMIECLDLEIQANTCENSSNQENEFVTNFTVTVPAGSGPCGDAPLQSNSTSVGVTLDSYTETPNALPEYVDITIGMTISVPPMIDLIANKVGVGLTLCDPDGNILCYNILVSGSECGNCLPLDINSDANCMDSNPVDGLYDYTGKITFNLDPLFSKYEQCNGISSQVNFQIDEFEDDNGSISIDYSIQASATDFNISTILCVEGNNGIEYCIPVTINVPDPCPEPPTDCLQDWGDKITEAKSCEVIDGQVQYTVNMDGIFLNSNANDLILCDENMFGTIDGGSVEVTGTLTGSPSDKISFNAIITMPCGFDTDEVFELRIILCDEDGKMQCIVFNVRFRDCDADCDDRDDDGHNSDGRNDTVDNKIKDDYFKIYPNPVSSLLTILSDIDPNKQHIVSIFDPIGKVLITDLKLNSSETSIDVSNLKSGVHFVKIVDGLNRIVQIEKIIILK